MPGQAPATLLDAVEIDEDLLEAPEFNVFPDVPCEPQLEEDVLDLWDDIVSYDGPTGISIDLLRRSRLVYTAPECTDEQRRIKSQETESHENDEDPSTIYEHPLLQQAHEYIIDNKLTTLQGDRLLDLWTQVQNNDCKSF